MAVGVAIHGGEGVFPARTGGEGEEQAGDAGARNIDEIVEARRSPAEGQMAR